MTNEAQSPMEHRGPLMQHVITVMSAVGIYRTILFAGIVIYYANSLTSDEPNRLSVMIQYRKWNEKQQAGENPNRRAHPFWWSISTFHLVDFP